MYTLTIGMLSRERRMLVYRIHRLFYIFNNPPVKKTLQQKVLDQIISANKVIQTVELVGVQGNTTAYEQAVLNMFVKEMNPKTIFEIGTFDGRTTLNFAINSSEDTEIYTFDLPKDEIDTALLKVSTSDQKLINKNVTGSRFLSERGQRLINDRKITQLYGDTATFDFSPYYNSIDFVFVDAAHTYEYVKNDSEIALKLLRNGKGTILWHDYDDKHGGSVQAINEILEKNPSWNMFHVADTNIACLILK